MHRLSDNKIILITRKTRLQDLIIRFNTIEQVRFYIEHMGSDFSDYLAEDEQYRKSVFETCSALESLGRLQMVDREYLPNFIFG
ncbi:MAG: sugar kinase, partial [Saccharofermentanales bacterium]